MCKACFNNVYTRNVSKYKQEIPQSQPYLLYKEEFHIVYLKAFARHELTEIYKVYEKSWPRG